LFRKFMYGRYGNDQLNNFVLILSLIFCFVGLFFVGTLRLVFTILQLFAIAYWFLRAFSRNVEKRRRENYAFMKVWNKIKGWFKGVPAFFKRLADRKHKYFKCPNCKSRLRVPRGRGNITVTCPKCYVKFDKIS